MLIGRFLEWATCVATIGITLAGSASAQPGPAYQAFDLQVLNPPAPVPIGDDTSLVYELHLTNFSAAPLTLVRIEILDSASNTRLGLFGPPELDAISATITPQERQVPRVVEPGARVVAYLNVPLERTPDAVRHRVDFDVERNGATRNASVEGGETRIDSRPLPVLGPPLRGGPWVAVYNADWVRGHRRVFYAIDGRARIPGRFAIDWMYAGRDGGLDADGRGAEVLAVADAMVVGVRNDFRDEATGGRVALEDATGNYVALHLGEGRYAFYEHLAQGVRVRMGERVKRGQVIATLGATGQVTQPHLHFHVSDANAPLAAEGLPYELAGFRTVGLYPSMEAFSARERWGPVQPGPQPSASFPASLAVVEFGSE